MKKQTFLLLLCFIALQSFAGDGYKIKLKITNPVNDSMVYLAHYYAKPFPALYKADSARIKNGVANLTGKEKLNGGIYVLLLSDMATFFEIILNNGDDLNVTVDTKHLPASIVIKNSPENEHFLTYENYMQGYGIQQDSLKNRLAKARTSSDTTTIKAESERLFKAMNAYRDELRTKYPSSFLAHVLGASTEVQVPEGKHYLPNGKEDSTFAYNYYKTHYWDNFDFKDNRLINTPLLQNKLDQYFNKVLEQIPDTIEKYADIVIAKARGSEDLFKFTLEWLTINSHDSKIMGMDEVFVYLVEDYFMKGDGTWLSPEDLQKRIKRARDIAPNVVGNIAPELKLPDVDGKTQSLSGVQSKYTLLLFYSPDCGHCAQEIPKLDSLYRASLKAKGVKIYAVATEDEPKWKDFIKKNNMSDWINVADWQRTSDYRAKYDIYSTPVIYLLDEKKIIRGKRIDHTNIGTVIEMLETREKTSKN
ncbi:TlpA family protein disulfide reductase [Taibaiella soli]|uniref:Thioredoxin domain-containing protein n=1 Tax=Taibaiella soli TaxID=1649169 RepID=A0A2W2AU31_9BACT|nr:TlpA family protein disulfide reductase [Taibaiella soli]PZF71474.1 hypothetical protein DN068_18070 [Taibaiella soli]